MKLRKAGGLLKISGAEGLVKCEDAIQSAGFFLLTSAVCIKR